MKKLVSLMVLCMTTSVVFADNFFENNNPFPTQVSTPKLNNIYETEPAVMKKEEDVAKKASAKWWDRLRNAEPVSETTNIDTPAAYKKINEGVIEENNSFVVFPSK